MGDYLAVILLYGDSNGWQPLGGAVYHLAEFFVSSVFMDLAL